MVTRFENNTYISALKKKDSFNSENKIFNYVKKNNQFSYGDVSYQKFKRQYKSEGWIGRKIVAIPAAVCSGVILTISHLARAILVLVLKGSSSNIFFKANGYYIARDLQESFGWLVTLLADAYGQYLIQESRFHRKCYDSLLNSPTSTPKKLSENHSRRANSSTPQPSFTESNLDQEFLNIHKKYFGEEQSRALVQLTEKYLTIDRPKKALSTAKSILFGEEIRNTLIIKIANVTFNKGDLKNSLEATLTLTYKARDSQNLLITKIVEAYLDKDDLKNALKLSLEFSSYMTVESKNLLIAKIAQAYFDKNDLKNALKVTLKLTYEAHESKNRLIAQIVDSYFEKNDFENALDAAFNLFSTSEYGNSLIAKIANVYFAKGDLINAVNLAKKLSRDIDANKKHRFLIKIAQEFFNKNNINSIYNIFNIIMNDLLIKEIVKLNYNELYSKIIKDRTLFDCIEEFYNELAKCCYEKTIVFFEKQDSKRILKVLIDEVNNINTVHDFLKIADNSYQ